MMGNVEHLEHPSAIRDDDDRRLGSRVARRDTANPKRSRVIRNCRSLNRESESGVHVELRDLSEEEKAQRAT